MPKVNFRRNKLQIHTENGENNFRPENSILRVFIKGLIGCVAVLCTAVIVYAGFQVLPGLKSNGNHQESKTPKQNVLAATTQRAVNLLGSVSFNIPALFNEPVHIKKDFTVDGKSIFNDDIQVTNHNVDLGTGIITAANLNNLLTGVTAGSGITSSGGKNPVIANSGVLSLQGKNGDVNLVAGSGIGISGLTISNTANSFNTIAVGGNSFSAGSTTDTLTFTSGNGITIAQDATNKKLTISDSLAASSFTTNGVVYANSGTTITSLIPGTSGYILQSNGSATPPSWVTVSSITGSIPFSNITTGNNTQAVMTVDSGATLTFSNSGILNASQLLSGTWSIPNAIGNTTPNSGAFTTLSATGGLKLTTLTNAGGVLFTDITGTVTQTSTGTSTQCLVGGAIPSWVSCANNINYWQLNSNILSPANSTYDFGVGGTSTASALFQVFANSGNATSSGNFTFANAGVIQSVKNQNLTLGGTTTGNIILNPLNGLGNVGINISTPVNKLDVNGGAAFGSYAGVNSAPSNGVIVSGNVGIGTANPGDTLDVFTPGNSLAAVDISPGGSGGAGAEIYFGAGTGTPKAAGIGYGQTVASAIEFFTGGILPANSRLVITSGGNIGIGVGNPSALFDVNGAASVAGTLAFRNGAGSLQATQNNTLTVGGNTTGEVVLSGLNGSATGVTFNGYGIGLLHSNASGVVSSSVVNLASDVGATILPLANGGTNANLSVVQGGIVYSGASALAISTAGSSGQCLLSGGTGTPTWTTCAFGTNYWQLQGNVVSPANTNYDLGIGGTGTSSALFQVFANSGNATSSGNFTFNAAGNIQTTKNQNLTLGGATTGNIILYPLNNAGNVGIGTTTPGDKLSVNGNITILNGTGSYFYNADNTSQVKALFNGQGDWLGLQANASNIFSFADKNANNNSLGGNILSFKLNGDGTGGNVGVNTTTPTAKLDVNGTASVSGQFALYGTATIQATANQTLTIGGNTTGEVVLSGLNGSATGVTFNGYGIGLLHSNASGVVSSSVVNLVSDVGATILPLANGGTNANLSVVQGGIVYSGASALAISTAGSSGQCLVSGGTNAPTWTTCAAGSNGTNYWQLQGNVVSPANSSYDLSVGGSATGSAFQVFALTSGSVPAGTASTSGNFTFNAAGNIQTTKNQNLTLGGATTGNIILSPLNNVGNVGIGTNTPSTERLDVAGGIDVTAAAANPNADSGLGISFEAYGARLQSFSAKPLALNPTGNNVGIGTTNPTAKLDVNGTASVSGQFALYGTATIQATANQTLTIGGNTTGEVVLSGLNGSATGVTFNGYGIGLLHSNASGVVSSSVVNLASDVGATILPLANGGTNANLSVVQGGIVYSGASALAISTAGSSGQCLLSGGTGTPTWTTCAFGTNYWQLQGNVVSPANTNYDLGIGGTGTSSALFQVFANSGNATSSGNFTFNSAGSIQTTKNQNLTLGGATTGNIILSPLNNVGNVGIGTNTPSTERLDVAGGIDVTTAAANPNADSGLGISFEAYGARLQSFSAKPLALNPTGNNVGIGTTNPTAKLDVNGTASVSGQFALYGTATIQATANQTLTIGGNTTGEVVLSGLNGSATGVTFNGYGTGLVHSNSAGLLSSSAINLAGGASEIINQLPLGNGGTNANLSAVQGGIVYSGASALAISTAGSSGQCLVSGGTNAPTWTTCAAGSNGTNYWQLQGNVVSPANSTYDLGVGGNATGSALFQVYANSGNATSSGNFTFNTAGNIQTTKNQNLTLGGATTGNIILFPLNGTGNVGIGTTTPGAMLDVNPPSGVNGINIKNNNVNGIQFSGNSTANIYDSGNGSFFINSNTGAMYLGANGSGSQAETIISNGNVGIGTTNPTAKLDVNGTASVSGQFALYGTATIQATANQTLTIGGNTTGEVVLSGLNGSATGVTFNGYGTGLVHSNSAGLLSSSSINLAGGASEITSQLPLGNGGTNANLSAVQGGIVYSGASALAISTAGSVSQCLLSGGTGTPTWATCATGVNGTNYWQLQGNVVSPANSSYDLSVGGSATGSAFQVFALTSGSVPAGTASTSGNFTFNAAGNIQTTKNQNLTLGGATTGNIILTALNGIGNVGIGISSPAYRLDVGGDINQTVNSFLRSGGNLIVGGNGTQTILRPATTGQQIQVQSFAGGVNTVFADNGNVGIGTTNPTAKLDVNGTASVSGQFALYGTATIQATANQTLTIGGNTTGEVVLSGINGNSSGVTFMGYGAGILHSNASGVVTSSAVNLAGGASEIINQLPLGNGGTNANLSAIQGGIVYSGASALAISTAGSSGQCLVSGGINAPSWVACAAGNNTTNYWQLNGSIVAPANLTYDLAVGGTSTASALFQVFADSGNATTSGNITFTNAGSVQTTKNQNLTLGGNTTGEVVLSGLNGSATGVTFNGYGIGLLHSNASGVVSSSVVNLVSDVGATILPLANGGTNANLSVVQGGIVYSGASALAISTAGSSGQCLLSGGTGTPTWTTCAFGTNYWQLQGNVVSPANTNYDLGIGGTGTSSALFQVFAASGNATTAGTFTFSSAGSVQTTKNQILTFGGSTTGDIQFKPGNSSSSLDLASNGNVGIGTTNPTAAKLQISGGGIQLDNAQSVTLVGSGGNNAQLLLTAGNTLQLLNNTTGSMQIGLANPSSNGVIAFDIGNGQEKMRIDQNGNVGIGVSATAAVLDVNGSASVSSILSFKSGLGTIQATGNNNLILGGNTTGEVVLAGLNGSATGVTFNGYGTGLLHSNSAGLLSSSAINLAGGASEIINQLPLGNGGTNANLSAVQGGIVYSGASALAISTAGSLNQCLISGGTGTPTWTTCAFGTNYWQLNSTVVSPANVNYDLGIGGTGTSSALFQVFAASGNATTAGTFTFSSAGSVQTTKNQILTFGGSTTGDIQFKPGNSSSSFYLASNGNAGLGTTTPADSLDIYTPNNTLAAIDLNPGGSGGAGSEIFFGASMTPKAAAIGYNQDVTGALEFFTGGVAQPGNSRMTITSVGNVGLGTTIPSALLDVSGAASVSGQFSLYSTPTIQSTANKTLTLGGNTTGNIILSPQNGTGNVGINTTTPDAALVVSGNTAVFGTGENGTPGSATIRGANASGTDVAGANVTLAASNGTGAGGSGQLLFQTAPKGGSGPQLDNTGSFAVGAGLSSGSDTITTGSGGNMVVVVSFQIHSSSVTETAVQLDSQNMTQIGTGINGTGVRSESWYFKNPGAGNHTISYTQSGGTPEHVLGWASFYNTDPTTPIDAGHYVTATGNSTTPAITFSGLATNEVAIDSVSTTAQSMFPGISQVQMWMNTTNNLGGSSYFVGPASNQNMSWTLTGTSQWADEGYGINGPVNTVSDAQATRLAIDQSGNVGIGLLGQNTAARNLDVKGVWGGNTSVRVDNVKLSQTIQDDTKALAYDYTYNTGTNDASNTLTYNITGLPNTEGTFAFIRLQSIKGVTIGVRKSCIILQINATTVETGTVANSGCTASQTGASTVTKNFMVIRTNSAWHASTGSSSDAADLAEWIPFMFQMPQPGEIVSVGPEPVTVQKSTAAYDSRVLGIVSTNPHTIMGKQTDDAVLLGLAGRVPAIVTSLNGNVQSGDAIVSSPLPGVGMIPRQLSQSVGRALESFTPSEKECTAVNSYNAIPWPSDDGTNASHPCFAVPFLSFAPATQKILATQYGIKNLDTVYVGKIMTQMSLSYSAPTIALNTSGDITQDQQLTFDIPTNGTAQQLATTQIANSVSQNLTNSPRAQTGSLADLQIKVASLTAQMTTKTNIDQMTKRMDNLEKQLALLSDVFSSQSGNLSSESDATFSGSLSVSGKTLLSDVGITGKLTMGLLAIDGMGASGSSSAASITTLAGPLNLQSDGVNGIDILNGKITINPNGDMVINANITAKKYNIDTTDQNAASVGEAVMTIGQTKIVVKTTAVTGASKIFITPHLPAVLGITQQAKGSSFTVEMDKAFTKDVPFDWFIVN